MCVPCTNPRTWASESARCALTPHHKVPHNVHTELTLSPGELHIQAQRQGPCWLLHTQLKTPSAPVLGHSPMDPQLWLLHTQLQTPMLPHMDATPWTLTLAPGSDI